MASEGTLPNLVNEINSSSEFLLCNDTSCSYSIYSNITAAEATDVQYESFQLQSRFWVQRVLVPIIMAIGVIGNTVTIVIMTQRRMRSSTNCYLAALAIFDMSYLVVSFLLSFQHYPHIHDAKFHFYWNVWPYLLTLTDASSNSSVWLTVTFTVERYIAVCHPMKGKILCTETRAQKMIVFIFVTCFLITLPTAFEWKIIEVVDPITNSTQIRADYSELGHNRVYVSVYYWMISVLFIIVPFILLAVFNAFLIRSVHTSKSRRKTMTRRRETGDQAKQESKITVMLIAVVILFFLCQLPTAVILLYRSFHHVQDGGNEDLLLRGLGNIFNFLMAVNAAGNFVLYCLLSQKYRRTFLQIFCSCMKEKSRDLHSTYQTTFYSTVDTESPSANRRCSVRPSGCSFKTSSKSRRISYLRQAFCSSGKGIQQQEFPNTIAIYCNNQQIDQIAIDDTRYRRLLRGFRCPWKRQKVCSGSNAEDGSNQLVSMRTCAATDAKGLSRLPRVADTVDTSQI